jgi:sugar (pentulose or hexulose) kinase
MTQIQNVTAGTRCTGLASSGVATVESAQWIGQQALKVIFRDGGGQLVERLPDVHVVEGGQTSTGSVANRLKTLYGVWDYEELNREATGLPPGSEGVIVYDHFQGNRTPHTDPLHAVSYNGLTLRRGGAQR